ncbi:MAG: nucleotide sugar dehydrogenase [Candidatus Omnitrophota bacterium]
MSLTIKEKIISKDAKIAVIGLGYVGLPLAVEFAKKGFCVFGIDSDRDRVEKAKNAQRYILDVEKKDLELVIGNKKLFPTNNFSILNDADIIIICVPTPLKGKYQPNVSYILAAVKQIAKYLHKGQLIVLESTTYPGTTDELILPILQQSGLKCGSDFYLAFSPERIDPGNANFPLKKIPKIVGGITKESGELTKLLYENIVVKVHLVSSSRAAETVKLLENTFRLINISLINELAIMAHRMGIDVWEVIEAAKTKPFGFMPFYPSSGVGGHCLDKNELVFVKEENKLKTMPISSLVEHINNDPADNVKVLSFDPIKRKTCFKNITAAAVRPYSGTMVNIKTQDGRLLKVTDRHPMFVYNNTWELKYAKDLQKGDRLPLFMKLPKFDDCRPNDNSVDLISEIKSKEREFIDKLRIKPKNFLWSIYRVELKKILQEKNNGKTPPAFDYYIKYNILPLKYFYELDNFIKIQHRDLLICSGRGPSYSEINAVIDLDEDFCRLIGYYLSEGCLTKDKSYRVRFSFNRSEKEYIEDVCAIVKKISLRYSIYESKKWHTSCIKVSSNVFGILIGDILNCGKDCYSMAIPDKMYSLDKDKKIALLAGIFRGDACVEHFFGKWHYRKNQKEYFHKVNTANISYFTSSKKLFQQLILLLHDLDIIPTFKRRKYALNIFGYGQIEFFKDIFDGKKKEIILRYLELNKNRPINKTFIRHDGFATTEVKEISFDKSDLVYSIETEKPHSFVTSFGIAVHNCIPKDPLYLFWKAKHYGFKSKFIKLAADINSYMPEYICQRVEEELVRRNKKIKNAKILLIGVTYKKDVIDLRKAASLDIIKYLQLKKAKVFYHDPLIPFLKFKNIDLKSSDLGKAFLNSFDCIIIVSNHSNLDYEFILGNSKFIFDTCNVYKQSNNRVVRL